VPLLKSLFCYQGFDNRSRFLAISISSYLCFLLASAAFSGTVLLLLTYALLTTVIAFTTLRRLNDALLNNKLTLLPSISFALTCIATLLIDSANSYWLLFIPALSSAFFLTYTEKKQQHYILGYAGPIDLSTFLQNDNKQTHRIEPTLAQAGANSNVNNPLVQEAVLATNESLQSSQQVPWEIQEEADKDVHKKALEKVLEKTQSQENQDLGVRIRLALFGGKEQRKELGKEVGAKKSRFIIIAVIIALALIVTTIIIVSSFSSTDKIEDVKNQIVNKPIESSRLYPLAMPDNFTLYLSKHQGLIIHWQADEVNNDKVWSQTTAQGDKSCKAITFNNKETVRTLDVKVENNSDYYAQFSPLDSKKLIQAIAFRGNFSLCGYKFSLKGSQAALAKNEHYADIVDYR